MTHTLHPPPVPPAPAPATPAESLAPAPVDSPDQSPADTLLGVSASLGGRRWVRRPGCDRQALAISQRLDLPEIIGRVLAGRGVTADTAADVLHPTLRALLPDPAHLLDMDKAVARLSAAAQARETIGIFGDYDVDGATATALLHRFFRALGLPVLTHIPDRTKEGYGPNAPALADLAARGAGVVVTVDCGINAFAALEAAADQGLDVIVCDHHEAPVALPPAVAVINPKRLDETSPHPHLAAVGVAFLLAVAVNRALRDSGWLASTGRPPPDLMTLLDLVALGTVCDMVPLIGVNRALVHRGLEVLNAGGNPGIAALIEVCGIRDPVTAFHLGFLLGPRVNAGGRVGEAGMGAALLASDDPALCQRLARELDAVNGARKDIEAAVLAEAIEQAETLALAPPSGETTDADPPPLVFVAGRDWHPGVVGIVASRLKDRYGLPACVVSLEGGIAKGSGRSVTGLDLGRAVMAGREAGLLEAGGGHAMAAGFTLAEENLAAFRQFLGAHLARQLAGGGLETLLEIDGLLDVRAVTGELVGVLEQAGPYGAGNPEPRFALPGVRIGRADVVGMGHVRVFAQGPGGGSVKGLAFKAADSELGHALLSGQGRCVHLAGSLRRDTFQGRSGAFLVIDDLAPAGP